MKSIPRGQCNDIFKKIQEEGRGRVRQKEPDGSVLESWFPSLQGLREESIPMSIQMQILSKTRFPHLWNEDIASSRVILQSIEDNHSAWPGSPGIWELFANRNQRGTSLTNSWICYRTENKDSKEAVTQSGSGPEGCGHKVIYVFHRAPFAVPLSLPCPPGC